MRKINYIGLISGLAAALFLAACTAGPEQGAVKILSIKPDINTVLHVNNRLDVEVTVEYTLKSEPGEISLVIQNETASGGDRFIASVKQELAAGSGTLTLKKSVIVPETTMIGVYTPISPGGLYKKTSIVDSKNFKVDLPKQLK